MDKEPRVPTNPVHSHYSRTVLQDSHLLHYKCSPLHEINPTRNPTSLKYKKKQKALDPPCLFSNCSVSLLLTATHWVICIVSLQFPPHFPSSSFSPQLHQNCSSQGQQWLHMANSTVLILFDSAAFFICFQDTTLSISSFISHPSVSSVVLRHLPAPREQPWVSSLFGLSTWLLHLISNKHLEFNLSQTEPLISSFKMRSSHSLFHLSDWPFYSSKLLRTKPWCWEWYQQNWRVGSSKLPSSHIENIEKQAETERTLSEL